MFAWLELKGGDFSDKTDADLKLNFPIFVLFVFLS